MPDNNHTPELPPMKVCSKCGETLPATTEFFHKNKASKDGLLSSCKVCKCEHERKHYEENREHILKHRENREKITGYKRKYYEENRETELERARKWHKANPEKTRAKARKYRESNREKVRAQVRKYHEENPEKVRAPVRKYREENREAIRERVRKRNEAHPEKRRAIVHRRRARKVKNGGSHTAADIRLQYDSQNGKCWWCGEPVNRDEYHVDHVIPLSRGGSNDASNLCIACPACNLSKGAKLPHEWNGRLF